MKKAFHPELHNVTARCACGFSFQTTSTMPELRATICSNCHPYFSGAQKFIDTAGRIEKFEQRYKKFQAAAVEPVKEKGKQKAKEIKAVAAPAPKAKKKEVKATKK